MAFLCKLIAGLTLLLTTTAELVLQLNGLNDHRVQQRQTEFVCFETATAQWPPSNTTWFVSFATTTGQLAQWPPRNTTWFNVCLF